EHADLESGALRELQSQTILDVEGRHRLAVGAVVETPVGEHAVDVAEQPTQASGALDELLVADRGGQNSSSRQRSCRWTMPTRCSPSHTKSEVMRWSSIVLSAAEASWSGSMVRGFVRMHSPAVWRRRPSSCSSS